MFISLYTLDKTIKNLKNTNDKNNKKFNINSFQFILIYLNFVLLF